MKQVKKQNIHQKQSMLYVICNTKIHRLKNQGLKKSLVVFCFFLFAMALVNMCLLLIKLLANHFLRYKKV